MKLTPDRHKLDTSILPVSLVALAIMSGACAFSKNEAIPTATEALEKEQKQQNFDGQLTEQNVSFEYPEDPSPNQYHLVVRWPEGVKRMIVRIGDRDPVVVLEQNFFSTTSSLEGGQPVKVILESQHSFGGGMISSKTFVAVPPKDLVFKDAQTKLDQNSPVTLSARRAFFIGQGQLNANGRNVTLEVNKVIIQDDTTTKPHILSLSPDSYAVNRTDLLGTHVVIKADKVEGHLRIAMNGFNGMKKARSGDALDRASSITVKSDTEATAGTDAIPGQEGNRSRIIRTPDGAVSDPIPFCAVPAKAGRDGANGDKGSRGEDAWPGGSTGKLAVDVKDDSKMVITVFLNPGSPGEPGEGGLGQRGGRAGKPAPVVGTTCPGAPGGNAGANGSQGPSGAESKVYGKAWCPELGMIRFTRIVANGAACQHD